METLIQTVHKLGFNNIISLNEVDLFLISSGAMLLLSIVISCLWGKRIISDKAAKYSSCSAWAFMVIPVCSAFEPPVAVGLTMIYVLNTLFLWEVVVRLRIKQEEREKKLHASPHTDLNGTPTSVSYRQFLLTLLSLTGWGIAVAIPLTAVLKYAPGFITSLHTDGQIYAFSMRPLPSWVIFAVLPLIIIEWMLAVLLLSGMEKSKRATYLAVLIAFVLTSYSGVLGTCFGHFNSNGIGYITPQNYFQEKAVTWRQIDRVIIRYSWPETGWFIVETRRPDPPPSFFIPFNIKTDHKAWRDMLVTLQSHNIQITSLTKQDDMTYLSVSTDKRTREFYRLLQGKPIDTNKTAQAVEKPLVKDNEFIHGIINGTHLGAEVQEVIGKLGMPDKRTDRGPGSLQLDYGDIGYGFKESRLVIVVSHSKTVGMFGAKVGMSIPEVKNILGEPSIETFPPRRMSLGYQAGSSSLEIWSSSEDAPISLIIFKSIPAKPHPPPE